MLYHIQIQPLIYYIHKPAGELLRHIYILIIQYMTPSKNTQISRPLSFLSLESIASGSGNCLLSHSKSHHWNSSHPEAVEVEYLERNVTLCHAVDKGSNSLLIVLGGKGGGEPRGGQSVLCRREVRACLSVWCSLKAPRQCLRRR